MNPLLGPFEIPGYYVGDCRGLLAALPDDSVHCVVTSPPYWGLRDYGLPPSVWGGGPMCLHSWGAGIRQHRGGPPGKGAMLLGGRSVCGEHEKVKDIDSGALCEDCGAWRGQLGLEPTPQAFVEHLVQVLREVRRVLRPDGTLWLNLGDSYAASSTSGHHRGKGAPAFNGHGRPQTPREYENPPRFPPAPGLKPKDLVGIPWRVAFALQADGWWLRSDIIWAKPNPMPESVTDRPTKAHEYLFLLAKSESYHYDADAIMDRATGRSSGRRAHDKAGVGAGFEIRSGFVKDGTVERQSRNRRTVWTIATEPTPDAHFATFPKRLVEPCILAGCPPRGVVLDPFGGSGTVGRVAEDHGRGWLLFDLSPAYAKIADRKTAQRSLLGLVATPTEAA